MNFNDKIKLIKDVADKIKETRDAVTRTPLNRELLNHKTDEWANKLSGISAGYKAELDAMIHHTNKGRTLYEKQADVTVGYPDNGKRKAIQLKATGAAAAYTVDDLIKDAIVQLTGVNGEKPRRNDRRVADITIMNPDNPWPLHLKGATAPIGTIIPKAESRIIALLRTLDNDNKTGYKPKKLGISHTTDPGNRDTVGRRSSAYIYSDIPHLTIKIRRASPGEWRLMAFNVMIIDGMFDVALVKCDDDARPERNLGPAVIIGGRDSLALPRRRGGDDSTDGRKESVRTSRNLDASLRTGRQGSRDDDRSRTPLKPPASPGK